MPRPRVRRSSRDSNKVLIIYGATVGRRGAGLLFRPSETILNVTTGGTFTGVVNLFVIAEDNPDADYGLTLT